MTIKMWGGVLTKDVIIVLSIKTLAWQMSFVNVETHFALNVVKNHTDLAIAKQQWHGEQRTQMKVRISIGF
jgi:hypothetical protein